MKSGGIFAKLLKKGAWHDAHVKSYETICASSRQREPG
jgi:hypothetical protein